MTPWAMYHRLSCWVIALAALTSLCAPAHAQELPHPVALPLASVTEVLADAGVQVPPQALLDAYSAYLEGYLPALAKADAGMRALLAQMRVNGDPIYGPRDAARFIEIERAAMEDERQLADTLMNALAASAPGQDGACASARKLLALEVLQTHLLSIGTLSRQNQLCHDIRAVVHWSAIRDGALSPQEEEDLTRKIAFANLDERIAATRAYADACHTHRLEQAKRAEKLELAGMSATQAWQVVHDKAGAAARTASNPEEGRVILERVQQEFDVNSLSSGRDGPLPSHPARLAYLRAKLKAYVLAFGPMSEGRRAGLAWDWISRLVGADDERGPGYPRMLLMGFPAPPGVGVNTPGTYAYALARIQNLPPETQKQLRALGDSWMADDVDILYRAAERMASTGIYEDVYQQRRSRAEQAVNAAADALGAPEMRMDGKERRPEFANVTLGPELSDEERRHYALYFSATPSKAPATSAAAGGWAFGTVPLEYTPALQTDLCDLLRLTEDQRLLVATVFGDARERWMAQVEPLAKAALPPVNPSSQLRPEARVEFNARLDAAYARSGECFSATLAADQALFEALRAALGSAADPDAMVVAQLCRRTAEAFGREPVRPWLQAANLLDVPRAVLEAPLSAAGRKSALALMVSVAPEWQAAALQRRDLLRKAALTNLKARDWSSVEAYDASQKEWDALKLEQQASEQSWRALEARTCAQIEAALSPADAEAWSSALAPLRWPVWYPVLRADLPGPPELLTQLRKRLRTAGDQCMACTENVRGLPESAIRSSPIAGYRLGFFDCYIRALRDLSLEQLRVASPPQAAATVPPTRLQATLDRYSSRVSAAAKAPVP